MSGDPAGPGPERNLAADPALTWSIGLRKGFRAFRWVLLAGLLQAASAQAQARDLAVLLHQNADETALRTAILQPFSDASGVAVAASGWTGGLDALRTAITTAPVDVILGTAMEVQDGCDAGILEKLDWAALGGRDRLAANATSDCGLGALSHATVLAWDRDKYPGTPSWVDFWDVVKAPGKRGLRLGARGNLEFALLADGVAQADVYRTLRTDAGIDRAFRKLDQIRPYLVWWSDDAQAARILASGEVLMTSAPATAIVRINRAEGRAIAMQWVGGLGSVTFWARIKGSDNAAAIGQFLAFAAEPRNQTRLMEAGPYGALARDATQPEGFASVMPADEAFWRDNGARLATRFDAWVAR
jgi:putative spermidine/putrescine transport system substrate-binding protein